MPVPDQRLHAFLTFNGKAEEALAFYTTTFPDAKTTSLVLYGKDDQHGDEGTVLNGTLTMYGQSILFMDMQATYPAPAFSWAMSLLVNCLSEAEFDTIFDKLAEGGTVMMGPEPVMDMRKCAWVADKFGVTWQLVWE